MHKRERNWGIDLMRMLCMLLIAAYHVMGHGRILIHPEISQKGYVLAKLLQAATFCAVDGYALISGYVGVSSRYRLSSLAVLWLRVWLYSVLLTLLPAWLAPEAVGAADVLRGLFPTVLGQYWYFTAYAGCFLLVPFARAALKNLGRRQMRALLVMALLAFSVAPVAVGGDPFNTNVGYSSLWLLLLYALGGYIGKYRPFERVSAAKLAAVFIGCVVFSCAAGFAIEHANFLASGEKTGYGRFVRNDSPTILACAVVLLAFCSRLKVTRGRRAIAALAPLSFSVYLIHDHPYARMFFMNRYLSEIAALRTVLVIPAILAAAAGIYIVCSLLDMPREWLFARLDVKGRLDRLETRLTGDLFDDI